MRCGERETTTRERIGLFLGKRDDNTLTDFSISPGIAACDYPTEG